MGFYSLPYLFLILLYVIIYFYEISNNELRNSNNARFFSAFIFVLFFGFRGFIGSDWFNYESYYSDTSLSTWTVFDYEIGFSFVAKLFHDLGLSFEFFVFFITLIQVFLWDRFLVRESKYISLPYIILISIFPLLIVDLLRNFTSILIGIQAIECLNKNKKIKAVLIILASIAFHSTGIFFFSFFFLKSNYFKRSTLIILSILGIGVYLLQLRFINVIVFSIGELLGGRFEYLAGSVVDSDLVYGLRFGILEKLFVIVLVLINYQYIVSNRLIPPIYFNAFFCYCFILLYFSTSDAIINRFSLLFFWGYLMVLSNLNGLINHSEFRRYTAIIILFICLLKTYFTFNVELFRYSNRIFGKDSYSTREIIRQEHYQDQ